MRRRGGFTLMEMLAVMLLLGVVVTAVVNVYLELTRQSRAAADGTRDVRRATATLDRVARDLESAVLVVKPGGVDPLDHPWVFYAEDERGAEGAERLRFTTRNHRPRGTGSHESDLAVVAYGLRREPDGSRALVRWLAPRLPEGLVRDVPLREDEGARVLIEDVASFAVRFRDTEGQWRERWDSSTVDESALPLAAEVRLALEPDPGDPGAAERGPRLHSRYVVMPLRPLDLEVLLAAGGEAGEDRDEDEDEPGEDGEGGEDERAECVTVAQCISAHPELDVGAALAAAGLPPGAVADVAGRCAAEFAGSLPIPQDCL